MAYMKFENPYTQRALEEAAGNAPGGTLEVVRRWRLFGDRAIHGDLASLLNLLHENEELIKRRRGRFAIFAENIEEKAELDTAYRSLGGAWKMEE